MKICRLAGMALLTVALSMLTQLPVQMRAHAQEGQPGGAQQSGMGRMGMIGAGRSLMGTLTQVAADHAVVKSYQGETYTVRYDTNTRFIRQQVSMGGRGGEGRGAGGGWSNAEDRGNRGNDSAPPSNLKPTNLKVGDDVEVMGPIVPDATDTAQKFVAATVVVVVDPERAQAMRERMASWAKTWLAGKVTAIDGVKVTLQGSVDNLPHVLLMDENTTLRKRREPVTLADISVGDTLMAKGAAQADGFVAASVNVMNPQSGRMPHEGSQQQPTPVPQQQPQ
jgi:hypothetical protein